MNSQQIKEKDGEYILPTYARFDLCLVEGKGCWAKDPEGNKYLDFTSGIGVNSLGWCDPEWVQAIAGQAGTLQHTSNLYYTAPSVQLAQLLCEKTGMAKVFFGNSGAEANEGAIKAARKFSKEKYGEGRATVVSLENSFHGRTMATLSATGQEVFHQHFHPFLPGFKHVPAGDLSHLAKNLTKDVCAVMVEPIQGEGGVVPLPQEYLQGVQRLCRERDILLIADEVQTGVGRTGKFLASEHSGITPDIVTLAKGLAGGVPIGAVLLAKSCVTALGKGDHATTFGANPVCCAGGVVVLNRLDEAFLQKVEAKGKKIQAELEKLPAVDKVTGQGLMLGISFKAPVSAPEVLEKAMEKGLLCLLAKDKLRLLPPLVVTDEEIQEGIRIIKEILEEWA